MNTPSISLPHVSLPDIPRVDVAEVTDRAADVWSTGLDKVTDLAVAAIDLAGDLAAAAAERFEELPDKAIGIAGAAIPALRPTPKRSKKPYVFVAIVLAVVVGGLWWRRRRSEAVDAELAEPEPRSERAVSAVS